MRLLPIICFAMLFAASAVADDYSTVPASVRIQHCDVVLAEEADLSPREAGILKKIYVTPGKQVDAGQIILQLEDTKAQAELSVAKAKLFAARTKADDRTNEKYAAAAADVAKKELDYNVQANKDVRGSVPKAKLEELELKCTETKLAIDKAKHDRIVAEAEASVADAEVKATEKMIELLEVKSPINGVVVEVRAHEGEAVQPAQPGVVHIVGLDRLWVQGQVSGREVARSQLEKQPVTIEVATASGQKILLRGDVIFVSPLTYSGGTYQVRAEVRRENRDVPLPLHPGMQVEMTIRLKAAEAR